MNRIIINFNKNNKLLKTCLLFISIFSFMLMTSCGFDNDDDIAEENMTKLVNYIDTKESSKIKGLFSSNVLTKIDNIDNQIESLFNYYEGTSQDVLKSGGIQVSERNDHGKKSEIFDMSYEVKTDVKNYLFAVVWCVRDDFNTDNVGISSIYTIIADDNPSSQKYHGDGTNSIGIYTNRFYAGWYLNKIVDTLKNNNKDEFISLFYPNIGERLNSYDVDKLFMLFNGDYDVDNSFVQAYELDLEHGYDIMCYYIKEENNIQKTYTLRLRWCIESQEDQVGAKSLYITATNEQVDMTVPNWTELIWLDGINIE